MDKFKIRKLLNITSYIFILISVIYSIISLIMKDFLGGKNTFLVLAVISYISIFISSNTNRSWDQNNNIKIPIEVRYYLFYIYFFILVIINAISLYFFINGVMDIDISILYSYIVFVICLVLINLLTNVYRYLGLSSYSKRPYAYSTSYDDFDSVRKVITAKKNWKKYEEYEYYVDDNNIYLSYYKKNMDKKIFMEYYLNKFNDFVIYLKDKKLISDDKNLILLYGVDEEDDVFLNYILTPIIQKYDYIYLPFCYVKDSMVIYIGRQIKGSKKSKYNKLKDEVLEKFNLK